MVASNDDSLVLTPREVQHYLKISRGVLYNSLRNGTIPCLKISPRKYLIPKHRFLVWLNGGGNDLHPQE
jgi:excisionase family DNA binding protein